MCGIFALFHSLPVTTYNHVYESLEKYFLLGQSRGPEFSIMKQITNNVLLGFHRLAINGLDDKSHQPISIDGIYLICNGEIYNSPEIRNELKDKVTFKTNSDVANLFYFTFIKRKNLESIEDIFRN